MISNYIRNNQIGHCITNHCKVRIWWVIEQSSSLSKRTFERVEAKRNTFCHVLSRTITEFLYGPIVCLSLEVSLQFFAPWMRANYSRSAYVLPTCTRLAPNSTNIISIILLLWSHQRCVGMAGIWSMHGG